MERKFLEDLVVNRSEASATADASFFFGQRLRTFMACVQFSPHENTSIGNRSVVAFDLE